MKYRLDLDGIRALAVLMVIFFHLDIALFSGGHVGVDVFFVLSGLLITTSITKQIDHGRFTFSEFYLKRMQRLFPALFTTVAVTFFVASLILFPDDFQRLAMSAVATILSLSNFLFWSESGYWDVSSNSKALLHTWSLGVEEQFYLIWPALIVAMAKFSVPRVPFFSSLCAIGIAVCYWLSSVDISAAFYLLPARVFQFSSGALLALILQNQQFRSSKALDKSKDYLLISGLLLVFTSAIVLDKSVAYPGLYSLIPTLGAALLVLAGSAADGNSGLGKLLFENRAAIWTGKISYSLYLVHWPLIVLYRYATDDAFRASEISFMLILMFLLGSLLHYQVEQRFYKQRFSHNDPHTGKAYQSRVLSGLALTAALIIVISAHAWQTNGWNWRFGNIEYTAEAIQQGFSNRFKNYQQACFIHQWPNDTNCALTQLNTVLFIGNSHEPDGFNFIHAGYPEPMRQSNIFNFGTHNDCADLTKADNQWRSTNPHCQNRLDGLFVRQLSKEIDVIVYSSHHTFLPWNNKSWEIVADIKQVSPQVKIVVIGDYLETKIPCVRVRNDAPQQENCFAPDNISYHAWGYETQELYVRYRHLIDVYIDQLKLLCTSQAPEACLDKTDSGVIYSYDNHHKSIEFSEMAGKMYSVRHPKLWEELLKTSN
jgi:peptidoglycan/LPS O-acetylase OafA/YrhL